MKFFLTFKTSTLGCHCMFKIFFLWNLVEHPIHNSDFVLLYIHHQVCWIQRYYPRQQTDQTAWITKITECVYVVVQIYPWFKFFCLLFLGMVMYDNNMIMSLKQRKRKFEPRIKLNHNVYTNQCLSMQKTLLFRCLFYGGSTVYGFQHCNTTSDYAKQ